MNWMEQWYASLAQHNQGKCESNTCRHCKRERETQEELNRATAKAKDLYKQLKETDIGKVSADYNGGGDEGFVDYVSFYNKDGGEIARKEFIHQDLPMPMREWVDSMHDIAWDVLGRGFGTGDYSVSGDITLDVTNGVLLKDNQIVSQLKDCG